VNKREVSILTFEPIENNQPGVMLLSNISIVEREENKEVTVAVLVSEFLAAKRGHETELKC
jgi:hypothetical protein